MLDKQLGGRNTFLVGEKHVRADRFGNQPLPPWPISEQKNQSWR